MKKFIAFFIILLCTTPALAVQVFNRPANGSNVIGYVREVYLEPDDTLSEVARRYGIGYNELVAANPKLDPKHIQSRAIVLVPSAYILPAAPHKGVVINISEMRLYYYPEDENIVITAPVSIGRQGWETPVVKTKIIAKEQFPSWRPPKSIKEYTAKHGYILPDVVPPGPNNPLGDYAFRLGVGAYLIHGTDDPYSIGKPISSGCIRMYPEDVEELFYEIPVGTEVSIVNQPYKAGWLGDELYFEAHRPLKSKTTATPIDLDFKKVIMAEKPPTTLNWPWIKTIAKQENGYPTRVN